MEPKKDLKGEDDFSLQELFSNPKFLYGLAIFLSFFFVMFAADSYKAITYEDPLENFEINVTQLGIESNPSNLVVVTQPIKEINFSDVGGSN